MMTEISLNVLDVVENSITAGASVIYINIDINQASDRITITINDNGCGMSEEQLAMVTDPFFSTRLTRPVGLGVPFFKSAAESTGGAFMITSTIDVGTTVTGEFVISHIDRMPLGDMNSTIYALIIANPHIDFVYTYSFNTNSFTFDTRELRLILNGVSLTTPSISAYIRGFLEENTFEASNGINL